MATGQCVVRAALEADPRSRRQVQHVFLDADSLWTAASTHGYASESDRVFKSQRAALPIRNRLTERGKSQHIMFEPCAFFRDVFQLVEDGLVSRGSVYAAG